MRYLHSHINDFADAALQRRLDAMALYEKARYRGAGYLKRYELECVLKYLLLANLQLTEFKNVHDRMKQEKSMGQLAALSERDLHDLVNLYGWLCHFSGVSPDEDFQEDMVIIQSQVGVEDRYNPGEMDRASCEELFLLVERCIRTVHPVYSKTC